VVLVPQRKCTKTKAEIARPTKRINLPITIEEYQAMTENTQAFREWIDEMSKQYPELFPKGIVTGYVLHDKRSSSKMPKLNLRQIYLKERDEQSNEQVFTIVPSGVMPYMTAYTDEVEKALFFRRFYVPFWALSYVFGYTIFSGIEWKSNSGVATWCKPWSKIRRSSPNIC
jgi:hypothetical protein